MQRGFMELKNYIQQQIKEHFQLKKREEFHKVKCDINLEKIEIDPVTLFTVNGDKIESLKEIQQDWKIIVASINGIFQGLKNTNKPEDKIEQRILNEK